MEVERNLPLSLSEYCDCDQYTRWICLPCKAEENQENQEYFQTWTQTKCETEWTSDLEEGMSYEGIVDNTAVSKMANRIQYSTMLILNIVLVPLWGKGS